MIQRMHGKAIALLFFPSLSRASLGCQRSLTACAMAASGARALLQGPDLPVGNWVEIKHQLTPSLENKCRLTPLGTRGGFCFSHQSPLGDPTPAGWTCCILLCRGASALIMPTQQQRCSGQRCLQKDKTQHPELPCGFDTRSCARCHSWCFFAWELISSPACSC